MKYSGIILDKNFNFKAHTESLCKKASQGVGVLHEIKNKIDSVDRICMCNTKASPKFEYRPTVLFLINEILFGLEFKNSKSRRALLWRISLDRKLA